MIIFLVFFLMSLVIAAYQGYILSEKKHRRAEREQVIAFLMGAFRQGSSASEERPTPKKLAERIYNGEHLTWHIVENTQGPRAA